MRKITVRVPALITNIGPGLNCFSLAVKLYNYITIEETSKPGYHVTNLNEAESLASDMNNPMIMTAIDFLEKKLVYKPKCGIHITNDFRIPLNRGLSSMVAGVVGVIIASSILAEVDLQPEDVLNFLKYYNAEPQNLCSAILGGFTIGCVADEQIYAMKIPFPEELKLTLIIPEYDVTLKTDKNILPKIVKMEDAIFNLSRAAMFVASLCQKEFKTINMCLDDRLHQPYKRKKIPAADEISLIARTCDTMGLTLCGNGSSILIMHKKEGHSCDAMIKRIKTAYTRSRVNFKIVVTDIDEYGGALVGGE
ncbi:MAG TPA: hypothetical protein PKK26_09225 [Candidatus Wallbacteria bacterium]|nr:hypothetical protein [Candidatus Wallbacteria bacterium]